MPTATKVMIIRHAEKPEGSVQGVDINGNDGAEFLIVQGWQRAGALVRFFAPSSAQFQRAGIAQPQFLFASGPVIKKDKKTGTGSKSYRPEQTITPLSEFLGDTVPLNVDFVEGEEAQVAAAAVACDGVALIACPTAALMPLLVEIRAALNPCAKFVCRVPNCDSLVAGRYRYNDWTHQTQFGDASLDFVLYNAGFENIQVLPHPDPRSARPKALLGWLLRRLLRGIHRLELASELGYREARQIPLSPNIWGVAQAPA
jgi:hypothetical protein